MALTAEHRVQSGMLLLGRGVADLDLLVRNLPEDCPKRIEGQLQEILLTLINSRIYLKGGLSSLSPEIHPVG